MDKTLEVFRQIAKGLEAAHEKGIIHRVLKPADIKVTPEDKAKFLDLGLARALHGHFSFASGSAGLPVLPRGFGICERLEDRLAAAQNMLLSRIRSVKRAGALLSPAGNVGRAGSQTGSDISESA